MVYVSNVEDHTKDKGWSLIKCDFKETSTVQLECFKEVKFIEKITSLILFVTYKDDNNPE